MSDPLDHLLAEIRACRLCVEAPRGDPLPHAPRPVIRTRSSARIAVCGQAPGTRVHASGIPFTDPSGDRLRNWMGVTADEFYDERRIAIVPMGFCFPGLDAKGSDRPPRRECAQQWREQVFELLAHVEVLLVVGQYAQRWHLGEAARGSLTETVAAWREIGALARPGAPMVIPLPHPSWRNTGGIKTHPWFEAELLPHLRDVVGAVLAARPSAEPFHQSRLPRPAVPL